MRVTPTGPKPDRMAKPFKGTTDDEVHYYATLGTRAIWHRGWTAVAAHTPTSGIGNVNKDVWQLFNADEDRAETRE
jgi:arylsulfatase A-like enzyme